MRDFKSLTCGAILMSALAVSGAISSARASTITLNLTTAAFSNGNVSVNGAGTDLKFAPNGIGTATFTFASILGDSYVIDVTGQGNESSSFLSFTINGNTLGGNTSFNPPKTVALPSFVDPGTLDVFAITNGGPGNTENHISLITVTGDFTPAPLPDALPLFATGLAALLLFGWHRKRKAIADVTA
jgi:hypothetical protein